MASFGDTTDTRSKTATGMHTSGSIVSGLTASCTWKNVQSERIVGSAGPIKAAAEQTFRSSGVTLQRPPPPPPSRGLLSHPSYQSRLLNTTPCEPLQLATPQPRRQQDTSSCLVQTVHHSTGLLGDSGAESGGANAAASSKAADNTWTILLKSKSKPLTLKSGRREDSVAEDQISTSTVEAAKPAENAGQLGEQTTETRPELGAETQRKSETEMAETLVRPDIGGDKLGQLCGQSRLMKTPSGADIMIGLEDESGTQKPIEIDVVDLNAECDDPPDVPHPIVGIRRRVSITERILNMKNSEEQMLCLTETAETRKQELADLLDEHAHIVAQVSTMEVCRDVKTLPGANKENSASAFPIPPTAGVIHDV